MLANLDQSEDAGGGVTQLRIGVCTDALRYARNRRCDGSPRRCATVTVDDRAGVHVLVDEIAAGSLDVAVVCRYNLVPRTWPGQVATWPLADEPLAVLVPAGHPVAARPSVTFAGLRDEWWITGPETGDEFSHLQRSCATAGFQPRVAARAEDRDTARELVLNGVGVTLVPAAVETTRRGWWRYR